MTILPEEIHEIRKKIYVIRGLKVMLDRDLATLYKVETKTFNQAVKRNSNRFPEDFMFKLTFDEFESLRSQFVTSKKRRGGSRYLPYAFTEHGVAMLSSILKSEIAIEINIKIIRAFIELRKTISTHPEYELLKEKIKRIESDILIQGKVSDHKMTQLSSKVHELSIVFDQFQAAHIIVRKPEEGLGMG